MTIEDKLKSVIRDVPDFPKPGILFKDISTVMLNPKISKEILNHLVELYQNKEIDVIAGVESRGFLFGYPLAMELGIPFVLIRKEGKLPHKTISHAYDLEYGNAVIEIHQDAICEGQKVLIHDDLLATGGSANAAAELVKKCGANIIGFNFLIELAFLNGSEKLKKHSSNIVHLASF